ncbi:MAG: ribosomal subunit interface protein [Planctomycetes bacterium TMED75]|nr:ribosomal subunit interface protein [Planctomycetaceae bacterium]OUU91879.1 MAG: ribosomal subunit interface protein [Planctomycetes bacterium TMED75]
MQVTITGRHVNVTNHVEGYARERAEKLPHYLDTISRVEVTIDREGNDYTCEYHVHAEGHDVFVAKAHDRDLTACIDLVHDKVVRQLNDWKSRIRDNHH